MVCVKYRCPLWQQSRNGITYRQANGQTGDSNTRMMPLAEFAGWGNKYLSNQNSIFSPLQIHQSCLLRSYHPKKRQKGICESQVGKDILFLNSSSMMPNYVVEI